jgi:acetyl-CoA acetyltransferase
MTFADGNVVISGIGMSEVGRHLDLDPLELTADACLEAIDDAGLSSQDIDGLSTYPGALGRTPGSSGASAAEVRTMLDLNLRWFTGGYEIPGQSGSIANAAMAVASGVADHVLCFRTVFEASAQRRAGTRSAVVSSYHSKSGNPYGLGFVCEGGLLAQRYLHERGAGREQLAQIALTQRRNAILNPKAIYREPLTLDTYMEAPMISTPLCLYDCDPPVDGSVALVVSRRSASGGGHGPAITVESIGSGFEPEPLHRTLWSHTDVRASDVEVAQLYDGWSILVLLWLEALGLCEPGESASFVENGTQIGLDGTLPINTGGGQLSAGRLHGYSQVHEACVQLRGLGGARQVARRPKVALVSTGVSHFAGALLLTGGG